MKRTVLEAIIKHFGHNYIIGDAAVRLLGNTGKAFFLCLPPCRTIFRMPYTFWIGHYRWIDDKCIEVRLYPQVYLNPFRRQIVVAPFGEAVMINPETLMSLPADNLLYEMNLSKKLKPYRVCLRTRG